MNKIALELKSIIILIVLCCGTGDLEATTYNIAPLAKLEASSESNGYPVSGLVDGYSRIMDMKEWRSSSTETFWGQIDYPSVKFEWDRPYLVNRIILYDRPTPDSHIAGATIYFSDSTKIYVHAIDNGGMPKVIDFDTKKVDWIKVEVTDADGVNVGFSEVEVYTAIEGTDDFVGKVNPYIETALGRFFFFVTGSRPFGMISSAPMTRNKNQFGGGYNYNSMEILGFPQLHDWMNGGVDMMPTTGDVITSHGEQGWKSSFTHDGEIVRPGYHKLFLEDYGMWVEQTATDRVSMYRFTYSDTFDNADVLFNLGGYLSTVTMVNSQVEKLSDTEIGGSFYTVGRLWGGPDSVKIHFVAQFDKPMLSMDSWEGPSYSKDVSHFQSRNLPKTPQYDTPRTYYDAETAGVRAHFKAMVGDSLKVKIAVSYVSVENARENMNAECPHWDFNKVHAESRDVWNEWMGRIVVKGGTPSQQEKFYTDLWHVLLGRHMIDDFNGDYPDYTEGRLDGKFTRDLCFKKRTLPKDENGKVKFHMYNSDAFWLSQWNLNVLWGLAWPEVLDDFAACLVQYAENGGLLPRGPNLGGYSYIMSSCPATNLITSAYQKGMLTKVSSELAYRKMVENHRGGGMIGSKEQIDAYEKLGYIPKNAGWTVEAAFQDWALSQMAEKMGKKRNAAYYKKRSSGWEKLYNPQFKLLMPKNEDGTWMHDDPLSGSGWIEANAWQGTWGISHGLDRLADLMGGRDSMAYRLNYAFEQSDKDDFIHGYTQGYVSYANQPGCSNAHVFNRIGRGDLAQYWVRRVNEQTFGGCTPDRGYGGHDEDQGQMGGVSALMSIGLFSVDGTCSSDPVYDITSPVFDEVVIKLSDKYYTGKEFKIRTENNSKENYRILDCRLNGKPVDDFILKHSDFAKGGVLDLKLGK